MRRARPSNSKSKPASSSQRSAMQANLKKKAQRAMTGLKSPVISGYSPQSIQNSRKHNPTNFYNDPSIVGGVKTSTGAKSTAVAEQKPKQMPLPAPPPEKICGPDITQVILNHLNDFISQAQGDLSFLWFSGARELQSYARRNGPRIRSAVNATEGCPVGPECTGTYTIGGKCISGYHIDHILIMAYLEASYGAATARSAGQYNESFWTGFIFEGGEFEGSDNEVSNADLTFNEVAICMGEKMAHADENDGETDLLTEAEVLDCFRNADMSIIGKKPGVGAASGTSYNNCVPCTIDGLSPTNLDLPPVDL